MHVKHENKIPPTISKDTSDDHKTYTVKKEKKKLLFLFLLSLQRIHFIRKWMCHMCSIFGFAAYLNLPIFLKV